MTSINKVSKEQMISFLSEILDRVSEVDVSPALKGVVNEKVSAFREELAQPNVDLELVRSKIAKDIELVSSSYPEEVQRLFGGDYRNNTYLMKPTSETVNSSSIDPAPKKTDGEEPDAMGATGDMFSGVMDTIKNNPGKTAMGAAALALMASFFQKGTTPWQGAQWALVIGLATLLFSNLWDQQSNKAQEPTGSKSEELQNSPRNGQDVADPRAPLPNYYTPPPLALTR